uniref:Uncharacterized protein n=1 Tax=Tanacetum cinerariifolium TaxID=118510 RepID=A0A699IPF6_TANCI|nr:hypothetical protein [Tanacetum cinerariifolium]
MDLHWEMAMLTIRARRHFARECIASKNQENRGREYGRKTVSVENPTENSLIAQDGMGSGVKPVESKHEPVDVKNKGVSNTIETKPVKKNNFSPLIIEDWILMMKVRVKPVESKHVPVDVKNKGVYNTIETKHVKKNSFSPLIIEDWNFDDESKLRTGGTPVNTVRPVNTADSKPIVSYSRPISNAFKRGHSQVIRPYNKYSAYKKTIFNKIDNTVRVKDTIARERAVVSENMGREDNAVKASACWVWKAKHISASNTFKKNSYIDARGRSKSIMAWIPKRA